MARSGNQKLKLLYILDALRDSDEEHPVSTASLISMLAANGIPAERKSVYADLEALESYGYDIVRSAGGKSGVFLGSREFELPELKLLVDAVRSSRFVTPKKTESLVKKLAGFAGASERRLLLDRLPLYENRAKNSNESIYTIIDRIQSACADDRKLLFRYFGYELVDGALTRVLRRDGALYSVSPWSLIFEDGNYYLVAFDDREKRIKHYRIDKFTDLRRSPTHREGRQEFEEYRGGSFYMFGGRPETVTLSVANNLAGIIIDRYGLLPVRRDGDDRFLVTLQTEVSNLFYGFIASFGGGVRVVAPESAVAEMKALLAANNEVYAQEKPR